MSNIEKKRQNKGTFLLIFSLFSRISVLLLLCLFALWTEYLNLKIGYNHPRLVELSDGKLMRMFYEYSDSFFSLFGDPIKVMQTNGGMTWSIRVMGLPFTDPVAFLSLVLKYHGFETGFFLGLIIPLGIALIFGRIFCSYICPASLLFFAISRFRKLLNGFFYFPEFKPSRGLAWGILAGGLTMAIITGHGIWTFLLPYFAIGQTIFHGLAFGSLSVCVVSICIFALIDLCLGKQFTCRYLCPTGRILGTIGRKSPISIRRDASTCVESCHACEDICPMGINPKIDQSQDCSLCGECLIACPPKCLNIGIKKI